VDDFDQSQLARQEAQRKALADEENHYLRIKRVFGTPEGTEVLEWLLTELCGYWRGSFDSEREFGRFELGRTIFNQICVADIGIAHNLLDRRRNQAEAVRIEERRRIEKALR
jgi:hypothetical protein